MTTQRYGSIKWDHAVTSQTQGMNSTQKAEFHQQLDHLTQYRGFYDHYPDGINGYAQRELGGLAREVAERMRPKTL